VDQCGELALKTTFDIFAQSPSDPDRDSILRRLVECQ